MYVTEKNARTIKEVKDRSGLAPTGLQFKDK